MVCGKRGNVRDGKDAMRLCTVGEKSRLNIVGNIRRNATFSRKCKLGLRRQGGLAS